MSDELKLKHNDLFFKMNEIIIYSFTFNVVTST
jgi:hypothetical protein